LQISNIPELAKITKAIVKPIAVDMAKTTPSSKLNCF